MAISAAIGFINDDTDPQLLTDGDSIIQALTDNSTALPAPDPTVAALTTSRDHYRDALTAAAGGGEAATATKNQMRKLFGNDLRREAAYVEKVANAANGGNGDVAIVYLGGFKPYKTPQPAGILDPPANLRLKQGAVSGTLGCRADAPDNASSFEWRYATAAAPNTYISGGITTACRTTLKGLTPGTTYTVQVRAIGAAGPSDWSDPAVLMVI
jgi:hypothetical protein